MDVSHALSLEAVHKFDDVFFGLQTGEPHAWQSEQVEARGNAVATDIPNLPGLVFGHHPFGLVHSRSRIRNFRIRNVRISIAAK